MIAGRPFRFLLLVVSGWTLIRAAFILPDVTSRMFGPAPRQEAAAQPEGTKAAAPIAKPPVFAASRPVITAPQPLPASPNTVESPRIDAALPAMAPANAPGWGASIVDRMIAAQLAFSRRPERRIALAAFAVGAGFSAEEMAVAPPRSPGSADRWRGAAWMLLRRDGSLPPSLASRLGGAQAGMRVDYRVAPGNRSDPAFYSRISAALAAPAAAEAAIGFASRPVAGLPVSVAVERRQALSDGGRSDFALLAYGGVSDRAIGPSLRIDGYAQAGVVDFGQPDAFIDGEVRIGTPVQPRLTVGAGLWGGAQPGASRVDVGPQASLTLALGTRSARIAAEWRERVAGSAQPSSGPAITIGMNF